MEELVQDEQDKSEWHTLASWCCCAKTDESWNVGWFWSESPRCVARFKRASMPSLKAWHIRAESMPLHKSATSLSDRTFMKFLHARNLCPSRDCQLLSLWLPKRCFHGTQFHRFHTNFPCFTVLILSASHETPLYLSFWSGITLFASSKQSKGLGEKECINSRSRDMCKRDRNINWT